MNSKICSALIVSVFICSACAMLIPNPDVAKIYETTSSKPMQAGEKPSIFNAPYFHLFNANSNSSCSEAGSPLFITPLLRNDENSKARDLAEVKLPGFDVSPLKSYSGFITVNETDGGNLFFWFFQRENSKNSSVPLLVWLNGGPGASSLFGLFVENGVLQVNHKGEIEKRSQGSWSEFANIIYIDQPVGTGFSFTGSDGGYSRNEDQVAQNLYEFMMQFYQLFPEHLTDDLYLAGESYAGKYLPAFGFKIHTENVKGDSLMHMPLKGLALGDAWTDPEKMVDAYPDLMYNFGLTSIGEREQLKKYIADVKGSIEKKDYEAAYKLLDKVFDGDFSEDRPTFFQNVTGSVNYYNILRSETPKAQGYFLNYLANCTVRKAIHVGNLSYDMDQKVESFLRQDIVESVSEKLIPLIENYRVMFYNGQFDVIVGVPLTELFLSNLKWSFHDEYVASKKEIWRITHSEKEVAGFVRNVRNGKFYQVVVRGAGHMVPFDQPRRAQDMMEKFINGSL